MSTLYQILAIVGGGLAVAFVTLFILNRMGCIYLDPVHIVQSIAYSIRH